MDAHFIFRIFVVCCVIYLIAEFFWYINDDYENDTKSSRDIHIHTTKDKSPGNHGGY